MFVDTILWLHRRWLVVFFLTHCWISGRQILQNRTRCHTCSHISVGADLFHLFKHAVIKHFDFCLTALHISIVAVETIVNFCGIWCFEFRPWQCSVLLMSHYGTIIYTSFVHKSVCRSCKLILIRLAPLLCNSRKIYTFIQITIQVLTIICSTLVFRFILFCFEEAFLLFASAHALRSTPTSLSSRLTAWRLNFIYLYSGSWF